jgi:hypothetical protein
MLDVYATDGNWPPKFSVSDQTEMRQITCREQVRINFMNARRTVSGRASVLLEACKKIPCPLLITLVLVRFRFGWTWTPAFVANPACEKDRCCDDQPAHFRARYNRVSTVVFADFSCSRRYLPAIRMTTAEISFASTKASKYSAPVRLER